jgi:hypothetical protein
VGLLKCYDIIALTDCQHRYGCADLSRDVLQELSERTTTQLTAWEKNLTPELQVHLDEETDIPLPHVLMLQYGLVTLLSSYTNQALSMEYHQLQILIHRPWTSKTSQPTSQKGPGYMHARDQCIQSATAISKLLRRYEMQYTFRRMNIQIIHIIFSAALIMIFATISRRTEPPTSEEASNLGVCFRALDELGQAFEIAKSAREGLIAIQRRWRDFRRKHRGLKRSIESHDIPTQNTEKKSRPAEGPGPSFASDSQMLHSSLEEDVRLADEQAWTFDFAYPQHIVTQ